MKLVYAASLLVYLTVSSGGLCLAFSSTGLGPGAGPGEAEGNARVVGAMNSSTRTNTRTGRSKTSQLCLGRGQYYSDFTSNENRRGKEWPLYYHDQYSYTRSDSRNVRNGAEDLSFSRRKNAANANANAYNSKNGNTAVINKQQITLEELRLFADSKGYNTFGMDRKDLERIVFGHVKAKAYGPKRRPQSSLGHLRRIAKRKGYKTNTGGFTDTRPTQYGFVPVNNPQISQNTHTDMRTSHYNSIPVHNPQISQNTHMDTNTRTNQYIPVNNPQISAEELRKMPFYYAIAMPELHRLASLKGYNTFGMQRDQLELIVFEKKLYSNTNASTRNTYTNTRSTTTTTTTYPYAYSDTRTTSTVLNNEELRRIVNRKGYDTYGMGREEMVRIAFGQVNTGMYSNTNTSPWDIPYTNTRTPNAYAYSDRRTTTSTVLSNEELRRIVNRKGYDTYGMGRDDMVRIAFGQENANMYSNTIPWENTAYTYPQDGLNTNMYSNTGVNSPQISIEELHRLVRNKGFDTAGMGRISLEMIAFGRVISLEELRKIANRKGYDTLGMEYAQLERIAFDSGFQGNGDMVGRPILPLASSSSYALPSSSTLRSSVELKKDQRVEREVEASTDTWKDINEAVKKAKEAAVQAQKDATDLEKMLTQTSTDMNTNQSQGVQQQQHQRQQQEEEEHQHQQQKPHKIEVNGNDAAPTVKAEEEARLKAQEEIAIAAKAEEQARRKAEEEMAAIASTEEEARLKEARIKAQEEIAIAARAEEKARRKAEEKMAAIAKAEEEARRKAQEEIAIAARAEKEARRKAEEEMAEEARRKAQEEEIAIAARAEEETRRKAEEEARRKAEEEMIAIAKAEEEACLKEARIKAQEERAIAAKVEEEARRKAEEDMAAIAKADDDLSCTSIGGISAFKDGVNEIVDSIAGRNSTNEISDRNGGVVDSVAGKNSTDGISDCNGRSVFKDGVNGIVDSVAGKNSTNEISDRRTISAKSKGQTVKEEIDSTPSTKVQDNQSLKIDPETKDISPGDKSFTSDRQESYNSVKETLHNNSDTALKKNDKKVSTNEVDMDAFQVSWPQALFYEIESMSPYKLGGLLS